MRPDPTYEDLAKLLAAIATDNPYILDGLDANERAMVKFCQRYDWTA